MAMEWRELGIENWINTLTKSHYLFVLVGNRIWRERVLNLSILLELVVSQNFLGEFYEHLKLSLSCSLQVHTPSGTSLAPKGALLAEISLSRLINILSSYWVLRASPEVLSIWPWTLKLDEENSKHAGPSQHNGFGPAFLHSLPRLVKGTAKLCTWQRRVQIIWPECCSLFLIGQPQYWSRWFAISSPPPICSPSFSFMGGVVKSK
jgi:hypothetical protein